MKETLMAPISFREGCKVDDAYLGGGTAWLGKAWS